MKIVILDGYALNPGDLSYEPLRQFGELTIYDRTDTEDEAIARIADSEICLLYTSSLDSHGIRVV